jgi:methyl-accepting chemotaxis protein
VIIINYFKRSLIRKLILMLAVAFLILSTAFISMSYLREKALYYKNIEDVTQTIKNQVTLELSTIKKLSSVAREKGIPNEEDFVEIEQHLSAAAQGGFVLNAIIFDLKPITVGDTVALKNLAVSESLRISGVEHFTDYELPEILQSALPKLETSDIVITDSYAEGVSEIVSTFAAIKDTQGNAVAILGLNLDYGSINADLDAAFLITLGIGIVISAVMLTLLLFVVRRQLSPLKEIAAMTQMAAQGDMTIQMKVTRIDEFGKLKTNFNDMIGQINGLITGIKAVTLSVGESAVSLREGAEQTALSASEVTESTQELASKAENQLQSIEETKRAIEEISLGVGRIAESANDMADTVSSVASQAKTGNLVIDQATNQMSVIKDRVHDSNEQLQRLLAQSREIAQIVTAISEIANQTNLLSLNASIEAARAGEHGRGFNVVAMEIRKLAEQSGQSAENISRIIKSVQNNVEQTAKVIHKSEQEVLQGSNLMADVNSTFHAISSAMDNINSQVQETSASTEELSASIEEINATMDELAKLSENSSASAQNVAAATEEQLATMDEITNQSRLLDQSTQEVQSQVAKFKTEK